MSGHKPYTQEFKIEAVKLVTDQHLRATKVARDLGVDPQTLQRWLHALAPAPEQPPAATGSAAAELARLQREVEVLRQERDILKKAIGIFSRMPQCAKNINAWLPTRASIRYISCAVYWGWPAAASMPGEPALRASISRRIAP